MSGERFPARRARLSARGRATVLAIVTGIAFGLGLFVHRPLVDAWREWQDPRIQTRVIATVSAGPRPDTGDRPPPPDALFRRLPVGVDDFGSILSTHSGLDPAASTRWIEQVELPGFGGPYQVEYSIDVELTERIMDVLDEGRVERGHVIVLDPRSGRVIGYVSTDPAAFPADRSYPAASLVKVVTAAAALSADPERARRPCLYRGNQYRLTPSRVHRPSHGREASLERALATSNNQCFAQLAVDTVGFDAMIGAIERFGWLDEPAPGHPAGMVDTGTDDYELGLLGCGLSGCRITPLHAAQLAGILATGERVAPWWIDRVLDAGGRPLPIPRGKAPLRVMSEELTNELRSMLVRTTTHGTARSAFRDRRGRPKLRGVRVAGKTGNLSGNDPWGRYEWFIGAAPAEDPSIAIAVVQLQHHLWWSKSSEIAANVLQKIFCDGPSCDATHAERFTGDLRTTVAPILLSEEARR